MTPEALAALVAGGEGSGVEFKRGMPSDLGRELCGFANAGGGIVLIGVSDAGEIVGIREHNRLKSEVQSVARSADPSIQVRIESVDRVLVVRVPPQGRKPYSFGGRFFVREGASTQQLNREEIRDLFFEEGVIAFDRTPCPAFLPERDLTPEAWTLFRDRARIPANMEPAIALRNLGLLGDDGRMTHAGAFLLAQDIRRFRVGSDVVCALFFGTTKTRILGRRDLHGDVYSMIDDAVAWVLSNIHVAYIIRKVKREERPEIPEEAVREAIVNAVAHRDYRSNANVQIQVFHDRIEVISPGGLPRGMSEAELGIASVPRNALLFGMLHRMGAVERVGSGIARIREACRRHGVAEPVIQVSKHWFTMTFRRPPLEAQDPARHGQPGTPGPPVAPTEAIGAAHPGHQVGTMWAPSRRQVEVLRTATPAKSLTDLMQPSGRTDRTKFLSGVVRPLLDAAWLERTVPDKPRSRHQKYRLTEAGRRALEDLGDGGDAERTSGMRPRHSRQA